METDKPRPQESPEEAQTRLLAELKTYSASATIGSPQIFAINDEYHHLTAKFANMKFKFYIPTFEFWESMILKYFKGYKKEYGEDIYSPDIPVYIMYKA